MKTIESAPHRVHQAKNRSIVFVTVRFTCETVDKPRFHRPWNRAIGSRFCTVHDGLFTVWRQKCTCKSVPAITGLLNSRRHGLSYQLPGTWYTSVAHILNE